LQDRILDLLAGSDARLRNVVKARLLDAETALTDARAVPLVTRATEAEGLRRFIEVWAIPWFAELLDDARRYSGSVLDSARLLLEAHFASHEDDAAVFLGTLKAALKQAIPEGVSAPEFHSMLARLDHRSQRKLSTIEQDLANLRVEMQKGISNTKELDAAIERVRHLYIAGMAIMRFCALAAKTMPEQDFVGLIAVELRAGPKRTSAQDKARLERLTVYWDCLDPDMLLSLKFKQLSAPQSYPEGSNFTDLRAQNCEIDPEGLWLPAIDFTEGYWHLCHGRNDLAKQCLGRIIIKASTRQLGQIAAKASSYLIALQLIESAPAKFEMLNPLMRTRVENISQTTTLQAAGIPTPFGEWSPRPDPSFYDLHLMACVNLFNELPLARGLPLCNPLQRFDGTLHDLIRQASKAGARFPETSRKRPAIEGTSVKPYQVLRDHLYYRHELFGTVPSNMPDLPGMDEYWMLSETDKLRLLRFVDPVQFDHDLRTHDLGSWRHPLDPH
jgi:hypothetical protein